MKYKILLTILIITNSLLACGDQPLFTELAENRVKVIIKGTYESNNPRGWQAMTSLGLEDDSIYVYSNPADDEIPDVFMLDIAGMKVATGKHKQYFANFRKTFLFPLTDSNAFFNGTGYLYKNTDMRPDFEWDSIHMFIRKMIFNNAKQYQPVGVTGWSYQEDVEVIFEEEDTYGLNFNLWQTLTYYDYLKENYTDINRIFPLKIPIEDGFIFDYNEEETVLEIRLVIKNFIKKYEYEYESDDNRRLRHFYALSDWLRDVDIDEVEDGLMGGNVITAARYWIPGKTATIAGSGATPGSYVAAIKSNHNINEYLPPDRTRPTCDNPKKSRKPIYSSDEETIYLEELLDYYLEYEVYKFDYDNVFAPCVESGEYETNWNDYNTRINDFKIPQLVTTADGSGNYTFTNVPEGAYNIYEGTASAGDLPTYNTTPIASGIQVTESDFGGTVP